MLLGGGVFFRLHQRKRFSIQLAHYLRKQKHTPSFALSWGAEIRCTGHVLDSGNGVQSPLPSPLFPLWALALLTLRFADRNHKVLVYELSQQENAILSTQFVRTLCDSKRSVINHSAAPSSTQHPKHDQPWELKMNPAPTLCNMIPM